MGYNLMQTSFAHGEISEELFGRVDLDSYSKALAECKNFFVHAAGGISLRPGTHYICDIAQHEKKARLIPFQFSTTQTYILLFEDKCVRFVQDLGTVIYPHEHEKAGEQVVIELPYTEAELYDISFVQSADILYLAHKNHPPAQLMRFDHHDWKYEKISFTPKLPAPTNLALSQTHTGTENYTYKVSAYNTDTLQESPATAELSIASAHLGLDGRRITLTWDKVENANLYNIYKESTGIFGWIGQVEAKDASKTSFSYIDKNYGADVNDTPSAWKNYFDEEKKYPSLVSFYQQRLCFAASEKEPQKIWMSRTADYENFSSSSPAMADDAVVLTIAGSQVNQIYGLVSLRILLALTAGAEWSLDGGGGAISPLSVQATQQSYYGSAKLPPLVLGASILHVERGYNALRDLSYSMEIDSYSGNDLSVRAKHLLRDHTITSWAYQANPDGIIWMVRDDGRLLGFTFLKEHQVFAWHQHETDGFVENVCALQEEDGDSIYFIVRRKDSTGMFKRYIEKLAKPFNGGDISDSFFVDSGLAYEGEPENTFAGFEHLAGKEIVGLADGAPFRATVNAQGEIKLQRDAKKMHAGLSYTGKLKTLRLNSSDGQGTLQGRKQTISKITLRLKNSLGGFVGKERIAIHGKAFKEEFTELKSKGGQSLEQAAIPYSGDISLHASTQWNNHGQIIIEQRDPLPFTLLALILDMSN